VELKSQTPFVANGFERWAASQSKQTRATLRTKFLAGGAPSGWLGRVRLWLKVEWACFRQPMANGKASPKILW
jgi:hypothetical protein